MRAACPACGTVAEVGDPAGLRICCKQDSADLCQCQVCRAAVVVPARHADGDPGEAMPVAAWRELKGLWMGWTQRDAVGWFEHAAGSGPELRDAVRRGMCGLPRLSSRLDASEYRIAYWSIGHRAVEGMAVNALVTLLGWRAQFPSVQKLADVLSTSPPRDDQFAGRAVSVIGPVVWAFVAWLDPSAFECRETLQPLSGRWPIEASALQRAAGLASISTSDTHVTPQFAADSLSLVLHERVTADSSPELVELWAQTLHRLFEEKAEEFESTMY